MKKSQRYRQLSLLQFLSLLFLVPGLFGLLVSAILSTSYLATLPRVPDPDSMRMTPREIHAVTVYETVEEDETLTRVEYGALGFFLVGLALSVIYIEKRSSLHSQNRELYGEV